MKKQFLAVLSVIALLATSAFGQSQFELFTTNAPASTTTNSTTSDRIVLRQAKQLSIIPSYSLANTNNENTTFGFDLSYDGNVWTTTAPVTAVIANSRTSTNTIAWALLNTNATANARFLRFSQVITSTNATVINAVYYRFQE